MSERDKLNDYLATLRIEDETNNIAIVEDLIIQPILKKESDELYLISNIYNRYDENYSILFNYIAKLYIPVRDKTKYIHMDSLNKYIDIFIDEIKLNNDIDRKIITKNKDEIKIELIEDSLGVIQPHKQNIYADEKEEGVKYRFEIYNTIDDILNELNISCSFNYDDTFSIDYLLTEDFKNENDFFINNIRNSLKQKFINKIIKIREKISNTQIENLYINAQIISVSVTNENIILNLQADDILHNDTIKYYFENPENRSDKFIKFINEMGVNSVDELEMISVILTTHEYEASFDMDYNGWYILKRIYPENTKKTILLLSINYLNRNYLINNFKSFIG